MIPSYCYQFGTELNLVRLVSLSASCLLPFAPFLVWQKCAKVAWIIKLFISSFASFEILVDLGKKRSSIGHCSAAPACGSHSVNYWLGVKLFCVRNWIVFKSYSSFRLETRSGFHSIIYWVYAWSSSHRQESCSPNARNGIWSDVYANDPLSQKCPAIFFWSIYSSKVNCWARAHQSLQFWKSFCTVRK